MRNRLMQLLSDNRRAPVPMAQRVQRLAQNEAEVYLYDPIVSSRVMAEWFGAICPQDFVPAVRALDVQTIHLRVNCPGGDVFGAEAMCEALRSHPARVVAHIEGLAASAATSVCCACDEVLITPASKYMVHETWTLAEGNKRDLRSLADQIGRAHV